MKRMNEAQLPPLAMPMQPATDIHVAAASRAVTLVTVPAAWPAGVSALALAVNTCQHRDFHLDWQQRPAKKTITSTAFCN